MFDETPDAFMDDFGLPCVFGATSFNGLLNMPDETWGVGSELIQSSEYLLTYRSADVTLAMGNSLTVSGVSYVVRDSPNKIDDGKFTSAQLSVP